VVISEETFSCFQPDQEKKDHNESYYIFFNLPTISLTVNQEYLL